MLNNIINNALQYPDANAIWFKGTYYSYKDLLAQANAVREEVCKVNNGTIGVYTNNDFYTYAAILGVLLAHKTFIPLNHKFPEDRLKTIIDSLGIEQALCNEASQVELMALGVTPIINEKCCANSEINSVEVDHSKYAYVLFTSGSTGEPKGIPITMGNLEALIDNVYKLLPMDQEDKVLQTFELSFDVSIACTFMAWNRGATLYLSPLDGIIALNAFKTIVDNQLSWVCIAPSTITYLKKLKLLQDYPVPFVRNTIFTGEALPERFVSDWTKAATNSKIYNAYGPTENTVWSFVHEINENTHCENGLVPIGQQIPGFEYQISEEDELLVSGNQVFGGYWKNEIKTQEALIFKDKKVWYRTGDIVKRQRTGDIMYVNRLDNQVQVNGYRIELGEVEYKINKVLSASNSIVFCKADADETKYLCVILEREKELSPDEIASIKKVLPFYMHPKKYFVKPTFPLNNSSKIDRKGIIKEFS